MPSFNDFGLINANIFFMHNHRNTIKASFYDRTNENKSFPEYFRQTKNFSGKYFNIDYSYNNLKAEWQIIGTWIKDISEIKNKKILYLQQEPPECKLPAKEILDYTKCIISPFKINHPTKQYISFAPLQWTYDLNIVLDKRVGHKIELANNFDLCKIKKIKFPQKHRICSIIVSTKAFLPGQKKRIIFLEKIAKHFQNKIDFYGFGFNPILNKRNAIDPYIFSIGIENSNHMNYWTEKISDIYLGYTCPIYYGCKNINSFFNNKTFISINIENLDESICKLEKIVNDPLKYKPSNTDLTKERNKVLTKYNFFNSITKVINLENSNKL